MSNEYKVSPRKNNAKLSMLKAAVGLGISICMLANVHAFSGSKNTLENEGAYSHLLIGGSMNSCSSFSQRRCSDDTVFDEAAKTNKLFQLNSEGLKRIEEATNRYSHIHNFSNLKSLLPDLADLGDSRQYSRRDLLRWLDKYRMGKKIDRLADAEFYLFFDALEVAQLNKLGKRQREIAKPRESSSAASVALYDTIKQQVELRRSSRKESIHSDNQQAPLPSMLFSTASARDIFDAVDFYQSSFEAMGLATEWLPISPSMFKIFQRIENNPSQSVQEVCADMDTFLAEHMMFDRQRVFPDLYEHKLNYCLNISRFSSAVEAASGIFFNGGDQSKTLASFVQFGKSLPILKQLTSKNAMGELFIAGTSAGTAVQSGGVFQQRPVAMISNGTSQNAMSRGVFAIDAPSQRCVEDDCVNDIQPDDLTYRTRGGLGSFHLGILDTHFSERDRQARLIALSSETLSTYAFGVDETTGLLIKTVNDSAHFKIIGASGVFIVDNSVLQKQVIKKGSEVVNAYSSSHHYLQTGVSAIVNTTTNEWSITLDKGHQELQFESVEDGIWRQQSYQLCDAQTTNHGFVLDNYRVVMQQTEASQLFENVKGSGCSMLFIQHAIQTQ